MEYKAHVMHSNNINVESKPHNHIPGKHALLTSTALWRARFNSFKGLWPKTSASASEVQLLCTLSSNFFNDPAASHNVLASTYVNRGRGTRANAATQKDMGGRGSI